MFIPINLIGGSFGVYKIFVLLDDFAQIVLIVLYCSIDNGPFLFSLVGYSLNFGKLIFDLLGLFLIILDVEPGHDYVDLLLTEREDVFKRQCIVSIFNGISFIYILNFIHHVF
jgi:hypothetical protein